MKTILWPADGALGVRIFFCISGFLITYLLLEERTATGQIGLKRFYARRLLRIVPVNYLYILALFGLTIFTGLQVDACGFATALTYTKNYGCMTWADAHLWSLAVEEQFYILWPLAVIALAPRWAVVIALAGVAASPLSRLTEYLAADHRDMVWLSSHTDALMLGALAAYFMHYRKDDLARLVEYRPVLFRALGVIAIVVPSILSRMLLLGGFTVTVGPTLQAAGATYLICSYALRQRGAGYVVLNLRWVSFVGVLSYSLYIWQQLFFSWPSDFAATRVWILEFPQNLVALFAVALTSYTLVERPLTSLRARFRRLPSDPGSD